MTRDDSRAEKDWVAWHAAYDDDSPLHHRLLAVQRRIRDALLERPDGVIDVVSACAGEGRDLLEVLADHPRATDVRGRLVELDPELVLRAAANAPPGIAVDVRAERDRDLDPPSSATRSDRRYPPVVRGGRFRARRVRCAD